MSMSIKSNGLSLLLLSDLRTGAKILEYLFFVSFYIPEAVIASNNCFLLLVSESRSFELSEEG